MKKEIIICIFFIVIIVLISFYPSLKNIFLDWDDKALVVENKIIKSFSLKNIKEMFTCFYFALYHPFVHLSYAIEYHFFGLNPFYYHFTNLILHIINTLLVFWMIYLLSEKVLVSFIVSILFGIHPLHVEPVAWISGRKDVLYSLFFLSGIISYIYYQKKKNIKYYFFSFFLFIFSLLSKIMAITFPFILILLDYFAYNKTYRKKLIEKIPFFIISIIIGLISISPYYSGREEVYKPAGCIFTNILLGIYCLIFYIKKMLIPVSLSCIYPYPWKANVRFSYHVLSSIIILFILILLITFSGRYTKKIKFGFLFFFITIFPGIQIIPIGMNMPADRYSYIPLIGLFYIIGEFFYWLYLRNNKIIKISVGVILVGIILLFSFLTEERCKVWKNDISLWSDVLKNYPDNILAYKKRGVAYSAEKQYDKAISDYNKALKIEVNDEEIYYNRGNAYLEIGEYEKAILDYTYALKIKPNDPKIYYNRANVYIKIRDYEKAISDYNEALKINPNYIEAYINRGNIYFLKKNYEKAISDYTQALKIGNNYPQVYFNRAIAFFKSGNYEKGLLDIEELKKFGYQIDPKIYQLLHNRY